MTKALSNRGIYLALLAATFYSSAFAVFTTTNCGTAKSCMRLSSGCDAASADCVFFSWIWNGTSFQMELSGGTGGGSTYSAVAFGQVDGMQDADLYYCTGSNLESGAIGANQQRPTSLNIANEAGITDITATTANGVAQCTFTRAASITKAISGVVSKDFDLSFGTYYILLATGSVTTGAIQIHSARIISTSQYNMTAAPSTSTAASVTTAPVTTATQAAGCGVTKGCFQDPSGCTEGTSACTYFTWSYDSTNSNWNMEISGGAGGGTTYAGVAFGQVNGMRDADLYYCTGSALVSGAIVVNQQAPQVLSTTAGLTNIIAATTNGVAKCTFTRPASVMKADSSGTHNYDLSAASYYLLLAQGPLSGGSIIYHSSRAISANKLDLTTNTGADAAGVNILAKTHGALMITAWLVLTNLGMMIARHCRPLWPNTQPGGVKFWFTLHRAIMVTVLLCTAIAFIIIFVHVQGYSSQANTHAIIGIIVMALTIFNPAIAIFRPHPDAPKRWIFNWTHRIVGGVLRGLATSNLFTGANEMGLASWSNAVLGGMVGWMVLGEISMEILSWKYNHYSWYQHKKNDAPVADGDLQMEEPNVRVRLILLPIKGQTVKTVLLIVYGLGMLAFAITFYVEIANA